jgi:hypothetical protein
MFSGRSCSCDHASHQASRCPRLHRTATRSNCAGWMPAPRTPFTPARPAHPSGRSRTTGTATAPAPARAQPRRWSIVVVRTTTMEHRRGSGPRSRNRNADQAHHQHHQHHDPGTHARRATPISHECGSSGVRGPGGWDPPHPGGSAVTSAAASAPRALCRHRVPSRRPRPVAPGVPKNAPGGTPTPDQPRYLREWLHRWPHDEQEAQ